MTLVTLLTALLDAIFGKLALPLAEDAITGKLSTPRTATTAEADPAVQQAAVDAVAAFDASGR